MSDGDNNFFSRWSRRKAEVREGGAPGEPAAVPAAVRAPTPAPFPAELEPAAELPPPLLAPAPVPAPPERPAPTLADVATLTTQSDYTRFVTRDVAPEVQQAALKKLFADPHFNVMDGLDTYIDDYGQPDPLPVGMLRQMVQSQMLGLFDLEKEAATRSPAPAQDGAAATSDAADERATPAAEAAPVADSGPPPAPDAALAGQDGQPAFGEASSPIPDPRDP